MASGTNMQLQHFFFHSTEDLRRHGYFQWIMFSAGTSFHIIGAAQILEMGRAYSLRPRLWLIESILIMVTGLHEWSVIRSVITSMITD